VVNVVRPVPATASIQTPTIVDGADSQRLAMRPAIGFGVRDFFARVFSDLSARLERFCGKASFAMNRGSFDG
jgi:hypothetical protein